MKFKQLFHQKHTLLSIFLFILVFVAIAIISFADLETVGDPKCNGTFDGSDSTISQKYVWANLDQINPTLVKGVVEKATIKAKVTTYVNTEGRGRVGVLADGEVTGGMLTGLTSTTGDLGIEWKSEKVGPSTWNLFEGIFGRNHTSKDTHGEWTVDQTLTYTLAGRGSVLAVDGGEAVGFGTTVSSTSVSLTYTAGALNLTGMPVTADNKTLTVTKNREDPKAYECSHENCSIMLPDKHHHRVSCQEDRWNPYTKRRHKCRRLYYRCQTSTCPLGSWHAVDYACGHTDRKENASAHELQASCYYNTIQNGQTVFCTISNFYKCKPHSVHSYPSDTSSTSSSSDPMPESPSTSTDNTPDCPRCEEVNSVATSEGHKERTCSRRRWVRKRVNGRWKNVRIGCGSNDEPTTFSRCNNPRTCFNGWKHRD